MLINRCSNCGNWCTW